MCDEDLNEEDLVTCGEQCPYCDSKDVRKTGLGVLLEISQ
jgi:hypothetical protein